MKLNNNILKQVENEAKKYFVDASGCHDWTHVERVRDMALAIGKKEKANLQILASACLLHDIGRRAEMKNGGTSCHAEEGERIARKFLRKLKLDENIVDNICHCIICHRYRNEHIPQTIEAKVVFDADKLDSIGAVGVARDFLFAGYLRNSLYTGNEMKLLKTNKSYSYTKEDTAVMEYEYKLKKVKDKMLTKTGKKIAKDRHDFMSSYFKRFWEEVAGLK